MCATPVESRGTVRNATRKALCGSSLARCTCRAPVARWRYSCSSSFSAGTARCAGVRRRGASSGVSEGSRSDTGPAPRAGWKKRIAFDRSPADGAAGCSLNAGPEVGGNLFRSLLIPSCIPAIPEQDRHRSMAWQQCTMRSNSRPCAAQRMDARLHRHRLRARGRAVPVTLAGHWRCDRSRAAQPPGRVLRISRASAVRVAGR